MNDDDRVSNLKIEEISLESETIHKSMIEVWLQQHTEIEFGSNHGLVGIRKAKGGEYEIVKSYVEIDESEE